METAAILMAVAGFIIVFAFHATHYKGDSCLNGWFFLLLLAMFLFGTGSKILQAEGSKREWKGIPLAIEDLMTDKQYKVAAYIPEQKLLLIREGKTGFRAVIDPGKKFQGGETFEIKNGEIQIVKP